MHRLGFVENDYPWLEDTLRANPSLRIATIFTHLVGADEGVHNEFSRKQYAAFCRERNFSKTFWAIR